MLAALFFVCACTCTRETQKSAATGPEIIHPHFVRPDAGFSLAWISEATGTPQIMLDGVAITHGSASHYVWGANDRRLMATRSESGFEQLFAFFPDGGSEALCEPSRRARHPDARGAVTLFESGADRLSQIQRSGVGALVAGNADSFEPSLSADAGFFVFTSSRDGNAEIYRAALDGGQLLRLTAFHLDDMAPRLSPDARWIVFVSNREGVDKLFLMRSDGRGQRRLTHDEVAQAGETASATEEADALWLPSSDNIVFAARKPQQPWQLYMASIITNAVRPLDVGGGDNRGPAISPDGRWLAWVSTRDGNPEIYALPLDLGTAQRVTHQPGADWQPVWLDLR